MKNDIILKVENLSKQYRLGTIGTGTISHDFNRFLARIRGKEDPYLKIGESNDRASKGESEYVWALKDINFEVKRGEVLGIIGKNGAGKSTLLKILSKVTGPTTGSIKSNGRIASLLEVGTGFHPEMTGKENIFLNGAILGMTKKEISDKLDEIVSFSGCERYIDTPVKRYSSGMKVRLAFAVAAHLEPDILIVDEVLAVGDAEFQKKAIGKMQDISGTDGRTVLFVSHNMAAVKSLCTSCVLLEDGMVKMIDSVQNVVNYYFQNDYKGFFKLDAKRKIKKQIYFKSVLISDADNEDKFIFNCSEEIFINVELGINEFEEESALFIIVLDNESNRVFSMERKLIKNQKKYTVKINKFFLSKGNYELELYLHIPLVKRFDVLEAICQFKVFDDDSEFSKHKNFNHGVVFGNYEWIKK